MKPMFYKLGQIPASCVLAAAIGAVIEENVLRDKLDGTGPLMEAPNFSGMDGQIGQ